MADGAFGEQTDPSPNTPEPFAETFANTGIALNARIVGDGAAVMEQVRKLWRPEMKLIVVTYCSDSQEQADAYRQIHHYCRPAGQ